jgi:hypothetical protein
MPALELYGKCKEFGYCDCGGFFGCVDEDSPKRAPKNAAEITNAMQGETSVADYKNHNLKRELDAAGRRQTLFEVDSIPADLIPDGVCLRRRCCRLPGTPYRAASPCSRKR